MVVKEKSVADSMNTIALNPQSYRKALDNTSNFGATNVLRETTESLYNNPIQLTNISQTARKISDINIQARNLLMTNGISDRLQEADIPDAYKNKYLDVLADCRS